MKQMKALGCVMDIAVEGLRPDGNTLANIMGRVVAEAALHKKSALSVPTPSRILEKPRTARHAMSLWLKAGAAAAVVVIAVLAVILLTAPPAPNTAGLAVAANSTHGDVQIIAAQSNQSRALGRTETILAGDTFAVGEGKANVTAADWNCRLNSNTSITYVATAGNNVVLEMKNGEVWANNVAPARPTDFR